MIAFFENPLLFVLLYCIGIKYFVTVTKYNYA